MGDSSVYPSIMKCITKDSGKEVSVSQRTQAEMWEKRLVPLQEKSPLSTLQLSGKSLALCYWVGRSFIAEIMLGVD